MLKKRRWQLASLDKSTERVKNSSPHRTRATNVFVIKISITRLSPTILTVANSIAKLTCDINHSCSVDVCQFSTVKNAVRSIGSVVSFFLVFCNSLFMHLNHKSNCTFITAKHGKKVVKRATADEESQTAKQELFIVTPSKNMQEYLDIVRLSNAPENDETFTTVSEITSETVTIPSTESNFIPTLSTNPFEAPIEQATVSVAVTAEETSTTTEADKTLNKTIIESSQAIVTDILSLLDDLTTKKIEETRKADAETDEASQSSSITSSSSTESSAESTEDLVKSTESSPSSTESDQSSPSFFDEFTKTLSQSPESSHRLAAKSSSFHENSSVIPESSSNHPESSSNHPESSSNHTESSSNHTESSSNLHPESSKVSTESSPTKHPTTPENNHSHSSSSESDSESKSSEEEDDEMVRN